ncbi:MAG: cupin domain-containing protein [Anaerolineales bacterium]|nr:cupin domain-containing protein [Anaerolineales bacterium]
MAAAPKSQVFHLADMINYQEGSVVSRQITKLDSGNTTLFAFDAEQGLSEHKSPYDAMIQVLEGELDLTLSGVHHTLKGGDMIIMPSNEAHNLRAVTQFKMLLSMFKA